MMQQDLGRIKNDVLALFMNDDGIVDALLGPIDSDTDIEYELTQNESACGHMHKFEYVPDINENADSFLNVETAIARTPGTDTTYNVYLYVFVFCHKSMMENYTRNGMAGTRTDILAADVGRVLNGNRDIGIGPVEFLTDNIYKPATNYYGRCITYSIQAFNRDRKGIE